MENVVSLLNKYELTINSVNDNLINIEGRACTFNVPNLNGEIVDSNSFKETMNLYNSGKLKPALTYNHCNDRLVGGIDGLTMEDDGLFIRAHLNTDIKFCSETLIPCINSGDVNQLSTEGYIVDGKRGIVKNDNGTYYVKNFLLTAVSIVTVPADANAVFSVKNYVELNEELNKTKYYLFL